MRKLPVLLLCLLFLSGLLPARAEEPVALRFNRAELEAKWEARIRSFLDRGVVPLIDLESTLRPADGESDLEDAVTAMDELGIALIAFDTKQARRRGKKGGGYRWSYYIQTIVNAHPDRFIPATNGGTSRNWTRGKGSYIRQLEEQVRAGAYAVMGEIEFRHYMSGRQCKRGRTERDVDVPIDGDNGRRVFRLSAATGVPFLVHHEPEDDALDRLERMLKAYPKAQIVIAHFGQIRNPPRQRRFGPDLVRRLLSTYPNLSYDLATGYPGRIYRCDSDVQDTVIWRDGALGGQKGVLKPAYKAILAAFSTRFVAATDFGNRGKPLADFLRGKVANLRLILRDLPDAARHDIAYRNAWRLVTGRSWGEARKAAPAPSTAVTPYGGVISDAHGHLEGRRADADATIAAMARNNIDRTVIFVKSRGGWTDADALAMRRAHPGRVIAGIGFQNKGWRRQDADFMAEVADKAGSGKFGWLGEASFRGKIGGRLHVPPDSPLLQELMKLSVETGLPLTIHHNPYEPDGDRWRQTAEYDALVSNLARNPKAVVVWAHWCGLASPEKVRAVLRLLPNLHCDLAMIHKPQEMLPNPLVDGGNNFLPGWKRLIEAFPGRFLAAIDNAAKPGHLRDFDRRVRIIRTALAGLEPGVARKVATENFHRLMRKEGK